jgi:hypothetical protein
MGRGENSQSRQREGGVFDWLFEGQRVVYVVLAALAVLCLFAWQQDSRRGWLLQAFVGLVVLAGLYYALDVMVETDREQIARRVSRMAAGVGQRSADAVFEHVSERFQHGTMNRDGFRTFVGRAIDAGLVDGVEVWGFSFPDDFRKREAIDRGPSPGTVDMARVSFKAKPRGGMAGDSVGFYDCEARFIRDPDGKWRLFDFEVFYPSTTSPVHIPGFQ